ncbi:hypothetical protein BDV96DRAFT_601655 [Lophiotrema nucula]|uniref:Uncharacterized protein n=1 Tax=Lophiotrema nucula TaxID=690887 RepID=A0A6A5Z1U6_9PLEO|nr:hypothetical protein BDV96DRAFT_601655 [Lophiotrema nucula]
MPDTRTEDDWFDFGPSSSDSGDTMSLASAPDSEVSDDIAPSDDLSESFSWPKFTMRRTESQLPPKEATTSNSPVTETLATHTPRQPADDKSIWNAILFLILVFLTALSGWISGEYVATRYLRDQSTKSVTEIYRTITHTTTPSYPPQVPYIRTVTERYTERWPRQTFTVTQTLLGPTTTIYVTPSPSATTPAAAIGVKMKMTVKLFKHLGLPDAVARQLAGESAEEHEQSRSRM